MEYLIFIGFVSLFVFLILKTNLFPTDFIPKKFVLLLYFLKAVISIIYGELSLKYQWGDTHAFYRGGELMAKMFPRYPKGFLEILTKTTPTPLPDKWIEVIGVSELPYGQLNRSGFIARIHAILHPITDSFYPTHAIAFSFLSLIGIIYICFIFSKFSEKLNYKSFFLIYFTPSIIYWTSGAHKDGLITFGIGMMMYTFYQFFFNKKFNYIIGFLLACMFSYYARNYTFYLFLPGIITFVIAHLLRNKISPLVTYGGLMLTGVSFFFLAPFIHPQLNFLDNFIAVQEHFLVSRGTSSFYMKPLEPTAQSFLTAFPKALWYSVTKPDFINYHFPLAFLAAIENYLLLLIAFLSLFFIDLKKITKEQLNAILLCLGFGFFFYTLLGLTVANNGALARYKSVGLIFIQIGFIHLIDTNKLINFINKFSPLKIHTNGNR